MSDGKSGKNAGSINAVMTAVQGVSDQYEPAHVVAATASVAAIILGRFLAASDSGNLNHNATIEAFAAQFISAAKKSYDSATEEFAEMEAKNEL